MAKRGPKPSGEEKVVYYRRVPREWVDRLDAFISTNGAVRDVGHRERPAEQSKGLESKGKASLGALENNVKCAEVQRGFEKGMEGAEITMLKREVDVTKDQEKKARAEVKRLEAEVGRLNKLAEEFNDKEMWWMTADESDKVRYVAGELNKLRTKRNEYDQGEGSA